MNTGKEVRLQKIWKHRRAVIVPYDHGSYGGPQAGIEDTLRLTERLSRTRADGVLVPAGLVPHIAPAVGQLGIMARLDGGFTKYATVVTDYQAMFSVEDAIRMGADAGIVFTFIGTQVEAESVRRLGSTAADAQKWGLPLAAEIIPPSLLNNHFGMNLFPKLNKKGNVGEETFEIARIGAEAGADIIKTRYAGDVGQFKRVVHTCGAKVIVAGGPMLGGADEHLLQLAYDCVQAEADGIIFGRNVWQHPRMEKVIAALCAIVHDDETVAQAKKLLR